MIYFIQSERGPVKIGYTLSLSKRLANLRCSSPEQLNVIGTIQGDKAVEKLLHQKFNHLKIEREWFRPEKDLLSFIKEHASSSITSDEEAPPLLPKLDRIFKQIGENIKLARLRRRFSASIVSERAGISRNTLRTIENGNPGVSLGIYARVLHVLGLENDLSLISKDDILGRKLQDVELLSKRSGRSV